MICTLTSTISTLNKGYATCLSSPLDKLTLSVYIRIVRNFSYDTKRIE